MKKVAALLFLLPLLGLGEDLRLRDGTVYHQAKVSEVLADGLIVNHEKGVAKIDFEQLPKPLQERYGYDPKKAARFRAGQTKLAQNTAVENQRLVKEHEARMLEKMRNMMKQDGQGFSYGSNPADAALMRQVDGIVTAQVEAKIAVERTPATFANAPFWDSPVVQLLGALLRSGGSGDRRAGFPGHDFGPLGWDLPNH
jgi:hypothetical protein